MLCAMKDSMRHHLVLGRRGEDLAAAYLCDQGLVILDRNWRCAMGEIDIVARDGEVVVVCEVKTRSSHRFGSPFEAITAQKANRLQRLAFAWLQEQGLGPRQLRFDVVAIVDSGMGAPELTHHQHVV